ncbi:hypothetical protein ACVIGV_004805 [Rhizobium leguminosarum]
MADGHRAAGIAEPDGDPAVIGAAVAIALGDDFGVAAIVMGIGPAESAY